VKIVLVVAIVFVSMPAYAQWWPMPPFYQQPSYEQPRQHVSEPRQSKHSKQPIEHHRSEPVHYRTTVKIVHREATWRDLSQDRARDWIKGQVQSFCGRYPKDEACQKPADQENR
jgi:hypothetical protein